MKRFKKLLLGLVTFAAMAVLCAVCAGAETYGDYEYEALDDGTVEITRYTGNSSALSIPELIAGKKVTALSDYSFYGCTSIKSVTIPDSVTSIDSYAFSECNALTSITISDGLTSIGSYAFYECTALTSIAIPDSVTSIGSSAFYETPLLNKQTTMVKYVGKWAVCCDKDAKSAIIRSGTVGIANYAFSKCTALTSITIPNSVECIGKFAFSDCSALTSIAIPNSVKDIGTTAFSGCSSLTSITIPDSVTSIGNYVFAYCSGLTSITIPDSVTSIGNFAFEYCSGLTSITIPYSVTSIGNSAFDGCYRFTSITIPYSVTSIGDNAFERTKIYCYPGTAGETYAKENGFDYEVLDHTHSYGAWTTTKAATCTASGTQTRKCSCGVTETKTISALGHNYVTSVVKPTYTAEGYTLHKCSRCGNSYKDTYTAKLVVPTVSGLKCSSKTNVAVTLRWTKNTVADGYILDRYDSANSKWVTVKKITSNATTSYTVTGLRASTTNKFRIKAYKSTASSLFTYLNVNTRPYTTTGLSVSSKTNVAITLKWNKNISADGYVLDKYDGTKWVTVKKITSNATTSYTVTGLKASTTYKFRLKAYKMYGKAYESSAFSYINVNTRPYTTTGFKISSTTKTTIKMQWNKNISASGYCIEKWDGKKWVQIKRFTSNANVSYTVVSGLKANTSYKFRLRAYKTIGTVNEYSAYTQTLTAKTKV